MKQKKSQTRYSDDVSRSRSKSRNKSTLKSKSKSKSPLAKYDQRGGNSKTKSKYAFNFPDQFQPISNIDTSNLTLRHNKTRETLKDKSEVLKKPKNKHGNNDESKPKTKQNPKQAYSPHSLEYNKFIEKYSDLLKESTTQIGNNTNVKVEHNTKSNYMESKTFSNDYERNPQVIKPIASTKDKKNNKIQLFFQLVKTYMTKIKGMSDQFFMPLKSTTGSIHYSLKLADELGGSISKFFNLLNSESLSFASIFNEVSEHEFESNRKSEKATESKIIDGLKMENDSLIQKVEGLYQINSELERKLRILEEENSALMKKNQTIKILSLEIENLKSKLENQLNENSHKDCVINYLEQALNVQQNRTNERFPVTKFENSDEMACMNSNNFKIGENYYSSSNLGNSGLEYKDGKKEVLYYEDEYKNKNKTFRNLVNEYGINSNQDTLSKAKLLKIHY